MQKNTVDIAKDIKELTNDEITIKQSMDVLQALEQVIAQNLESGNDVKIRSLLKFEVVDVPERTLYNGITKNKFKDPEHKRVAIRKLVTLKNLNPNN